MIAYQIGRYFTVIGYVNEPAHRADLDEVTDSLAEALFDGEDNIVTDSDVSVDLGRGEVSVSVLVKVADEGAAETIAMRRILAAFETADIRADSTGRHPNRQVELVG